MIYLKKFNLLNLNTEEMILGSERRTCFNNYYPFRLFPNKGFETIEFGNITIFYGGNGSGKSTLLNVIAEKLNADRKQEFNKGEFFNKYIDNCSFGMSAEKPDEIKIVTSDDVFDYLFDIRSINNHIEKNRNELFEEYVNYKYSKVSDLNNLNDYSNLKKSVDAKRKSMSSYVRDRLTKNNIMEQSNGESALMYFEKEISENAIYILDEPENSLSAESQLKLVKFIEDSARFFNCQFIISTHSPFLLSMKDVNIFDIDTVPVCKKRWTELDNVKLYHAFFKEHNNEFE
jgi:predicted ATPase